jgi:hypothetical protein
MNIPFDNLYDYIEGKLDLPASFYLFYPHGSRKISNLQPLRAYNDYHLITTPNVIFHDQEPLNFAYYSDNSQEMQEFQTQVNSKFKQNSGIEKFLHFDNTNLNLALLMHGGVSIYDTPVLVHSELNSADLTQYQSVGFEPVYWWSHAMIARDWYRYAEHDPRLGRRESVSTPFLIHSRGFTNQREYRLKFIEYLCDFGMLDYCNISMLHREQDIEVAQYQAQDLKMQVRDSSIFNHIKSCMVPATASASYDVFEVASSYCNVVLETQFNGQKLQLTEKILRPIACGQAFILAAAPGALQLLRRYGFETYNGLIDESYDFETDSCMRLYRIVESMKKLSNMSVSQWQQWHAEAQKIATRNRARFFSNEFQSLILDELFQNLRQAVTKASITRGANWLENRRRIKKTKPPGYQNYLYRMNERVKAGLLRKIRSRL